MGRDKSQLLWQGKPLYQRMVSLLERSGMDRVLISGSGFEATEIMSVPDRIPGRGPLSGIHGVLPALNEGDRLEVVPVDMPLLPEPVLKLLTREHRTCHFRDYSLPPLLVVGEALREAVQQAVERDHSKDYLIIAHPTPSGRRPLISEYLGNRDSQIYKTMVSSIPG